MPFKVIRDFTDANENANNHVYRAGDIYPYQTYAGAQTKDRLEELMNEDGPNNNFDGPLIKEIEDD